MENWTHEPEKITQDMANNLNINLQGQMRDIFWQVNEWGNILKREISHQKEEVIEIRKIVDSIYKKFLWLIFILVLLGISLKHL